MDPKIMNGFLIELNKSIYPHLIQIRVLLQDILPDKKPLKKFILENLLPKINDEYALALAAQFTTETDSKSQTSNGISRYYEGQFTNYLIAYLFDIPIIGDEISFIYDIYRVFTSIEDIDKHMRVEAYNKIIRNYIELKKSKNDSYWIQREMSHFFIDEPTNVGGFVNIDEFEAKEGGGGSNDSKKKYLKYKQKYLHLKNKLTN